MSSIFNLSSDADGNIAILSLVDDLKFEVMLARVEWLSRLRKTHIRDGLSASCVLENLGRKINLHYSAETRKN